MVVFVAFICEYIDIVGNKWADFLATKWKIDITVNIPKSFYKKVVNGSMVEHKIKNTSVQIEGT